MNFKVLINLKTYASGKKALRLCKIAEKINKDIIVAVQPTDIYLISSNSRLQIFSQHADPYAPGRATGYITLEAVKSAGAKGTLVNHSEHPMTLENVKDVVKRARKLKLKVAAFGKSLLELKRLEKAGADILIFEPPELVAGKVSVSKAKPGAIRRIANEIKSEFFVGAGIRTNEDVKTALSLGAFGVAFSSVFTKSSNPRKILKELLR